MMKKYIFIILIIFLISILILGCSKEIYNITVYKTDWKFLNLYENQQTRELLKDRHTQKSSYKAREIIDWNGDNIRFVDLDGKEIFLTGDKIEVRKIE